MCWCWVFQNYTVQYNSISSWFKLKQNRENCKLAVNPYVEPVIYLVASLIAAGSTHSQYHPFVVGGLRLRSISCYSDSAVLWRFRLRFIFKEESNSFFAASVNVGMKRVKAPRCVLQRPTHCMWYKYDIYMIWDRLAPTGFNMNIYHWSMLAWIYCKSWSIAKIKFCRCNWGWDSERQMKVKLSSDIIIPKVGAMCNVLFSLWFIIGWFYLCSGIVVGSEFWFRPDDARDSCAMHETNFHCRSVFKLDFALNNVCLACSHASPPSF